MQTMNYKETINLPSTEFSMKADLQKLEPQMQRKWDEMDLYARTRAARKGRDKYVLHDGPPYPTGDLHLGTGLNKVLKDFFVRYRTMRGCDSPFVPGWDCHGLPIEVKVLEELGERRETTPKRRVRELCRKYALNYVEKQKQQFKSLGVGGDWENPYLTLSPQYERGILEVFAEMVGHGFVCRDLKPVHWCYHCGTVLAEAELEYEDISGPSIFVNFPVPRHTGAAPTVDPWKLFNLHERDDVYVLIWTTTPWTLPANLAVAVREGADYVAVRYRHPGSGKTVVSIIAEATAAGVLSLAGVKEHETLGSVKGRDLVGVQYRHPFMDRDCPVVPADYVTLDDGTGCVHTAPGHGLEDYVTGLAHGLPILSPVDEKGYFTDEAGPFSGLHIMEGDGAIMRHLTDEGHMLWSGESTHSYPHCWRCHQPVIFRATKQWFVRMDHEGFRARAIKAAEQTRWVPQWGLERIRLMLEERPDWCISRQKSWGVPIPAFYCRQCGEVLLTRDVVLKVAEVFGDRGSDSWFENDDAGDFLPRGTRCAKCGSQNWQKESDIFDVWFESGSSHHSVCRKRPELSFPADMYLEGTDQYRGWFQLSLLPSMAAWGEPPYKTVLTHGFVVDEQGRKMAKSLGNFISVEEGVTAFRAEILRLWVLSVDYRDQISVSEDYIKENMADAYRRFRNTFRYLLGNVADFDPSRHAVPHAELREIDKWALDETARLVKAVSEAWEEFDLHRVFTLLHNFCAVQMSAVYLDALKDRLYCSGREWKERRAAQTVLHRVLLTLCKLSAPVLVHTAEEVWSHITHRDEDTDSVHLCHWPEPEQEWLSDEVHERWERILTVRDEVARAVEGLRDRKVVANNMQVKATLWSESKGLAAIMREHADALRELLMVSELVLPDAEQEGMTSGVKEPKLHIAVAASPHAKCARCWNLRPSVGRDAACADLCERCVRAVKSLA